VQGLQLVSVRSSLRPAEHLEREVGRGHDHLPTRRIISAVLFVHPDAQKHRADGDPGRGRAEITLA
jgi:hypothetical protein